MELSRVESLGHSFDHPLFEDLNFSLNQKDRITTQGSSGCGKSAPLYIISSLLKPNKGKAFFRSQNLCKISENERLEICRYNLGIVFQTHYLFRGFPALENIELVSVLSNRDLDEEILRKLDIHELLKQKIDRLSGGQRQRVSVARVICKKPKIIPADEATRNLGFDNARSVIELLVFYARENDTALFFVTRDSKLAQFCDRTYILNTSGIC